MAASLSAQLAQALPVAVFLGGKKLRPQHRWARRASRLTTGFRCGYLSRAIYIVPIEHVKELLRLGYRRCREFSTHAGNAPPPRSYAFGLANAQTQRAP